MINQQTRLGYKVQVPENENEDSSERFDLSQIDEANEYYINYGYVIFTNVISDLECDHIRDLWNNKIKKYKGKIYRQTDGKAQVNQLNNNNWVMNPILNIQSLNSIKFGEFKEKVEKNIFNSIEVSKILHKFFNQKPKIIQSMYFEGNTATEEHQDSYFLDSENIGTLTAGWVALEEIKADAGRFFVIPKSHKLDIKKNQYYSNILSNHDKYIRELILESDLEKNSIRAPYLKKGDILFWNSLTIHGSLNSYSKTSSRSSITFHALPINHKFLHWHKHFIDTPYDDLGNAVIYRRKNQNLLKNQIILFFESNFSNFFYWLKNNMIKLIYKQTHYK